MKNEFLSLQFLHLQKETSGIKHWRELRDKCVLFDDSNSTFFFGGIVFPLPKDLSDINTGLNRLKGIFLTYAKTSVGWIELASIRPLPYPIDFNNVYQVQEPEIRLKVSDPVLPELVSRYGIVQRRLERDRLFYPFEEINNRYPENQSPQLIEMRTEQNSVPLMVFSSLNFDFLIPGVANNTENLKNTLAEFIEINGGKLPLRIDSTCTSGQIYNDHGCDCKWQLQQALSNGFLVIHDPFADGRGWGTIPKNITELYKNGIRDPRLNLGYPKRPLNTAEAANFLYDQFGFPVDIRRERYSKMIEELSQLLKNLPDLPTSISILTDNKEKIGTLNKGLKSFGVDIPLEAIPTNSDSNCSYCRAHIEAKHNYLLQYK
jgi:hypothetical protein